MMQHFLNSSSYKTEFITILQNFGGQNVNGNIHPPDYQPRQQEGQDMILQSIHWTRSVAESITGEKNRVRAPWVFACDPADITTQIDDTDRVLTEDGIEYNIVTTENVAGQDKIFLIWADRR